jgi:hypothetical protein
VLEPQPDRPVAPVQRVQRRVFRAEPEPRLARIGAVMRGDEAGAAGEEADQVAVVPGRALADGIGEGEVFARDAGARQARAQIVAAAQVQRYGPVRRRAQLRRSPRRRIISPSSCQRRRAKAA